ncbi:BatD family protein [Rhodohalobacter mucosus]|nr:BatD family protein [Rhodohalobacter mucosus]
MRKTGRSISSFGYRQIPLLILALFYAAGTLFAQDNDFTLEATISENKIFIGEQFTVSVQIGGSSMRGVSLPRIPEMDGVGLLSATPSRSTSVTIVNGRTTTSTTYTFSFVARSEGSYTVPPISIDIDGETYQTDPIPFDILERGDLTEEGGRQLPDIFLEVEPDVTNPVPGQQMVASLVLYFKQGVEITSFQPSSGWRTDGFWKEELENIRQPQAESVILNGVRYRKATLLRYALFPSRSGELTLSAFPLNVGIRTQPSRNDPFGSFFGSGGNQRRISIESEPVTITVDPLASPASGLSINAVGDLTVERRINRSTVETGETLELITTIEGTGNIPLIRRPEYSLPDGFDLYTPQETTDIQRRGLSIRGTKTYTELLVPRAPGRFELPEERIAVYDPNRDLYRYTTLPSLSFEVQPASGSPIASSGQRMPDLRPVQGLAVWQRQSSGVFYLTPVFWILLLIPAAAILIGLRQKKYYHRLQSDRSFARSQSAYDTALDRIDSAKNAVQKNEVKECYNLQRHALAGFISDKLALPEAGLSDKELIENVRETTDDRQLARSLHTMLEKCATISYAPISDSDDQLADIEKTEQLLLELKKKL